MENYHKFTHHSKNCLIILMALLLSACSSFQLSPKSEPKLANIPDAIPKHEPKSRYGNPKSYVVFGQRYYVMENSVGFVEKGIASWYGKKFHGRRTSSGETYNMYAMTAAHKTLPLPTYVKVTNLNNGRHIVVKVNDRGPFHGGRIIDLSYVAAQKLDLVKKGTGLVEVRALQAGESVARSTHHAPVVDKALVPNNKARVYIQVGSFNQAINAENLKMRLHALGHKLVRVSQAVISGITRYRVQIGPFNNISQTRSIIAKLTNHGIVEYRIVVN